MLAIKEKMIRPKCLDVVLFSAFAYAISDSIKNHEVYTQISYPFYLYIILAMVCVLIFRCTHFFGMLLSGDMERSEDNRSGNLPPTTTYNWQNVKTLKRLTYF